MSRVTILALFTALVCGCDSSGPSEEGPLRVAAVFPDEGLIGLPAGPVSIRFTEDVDPSTIGGAITLLTGDDTLPVRFTYQPSVRTAVLSAPLLPGANYRVEVDATVRSRTGQRLEAGRVWSFATASWESGVIDHLEIFGGPGRGGPALSVDENGRRYLIYSSLDNRYATCAAACLTPGAWPATNVPVGGGWYPSMTIDPDGALHLLSTYDEGHGDHPLWYARCLTTCEDSASWSLTALSPAGLLRYPSLGAGADGSLHGAMFDAIAGDLVYGYCPGECTSEGNWQFTILANTGTVGLEPSLTVESNGRIHIAFVDFTGHTLRYATCSGSCTSAARWAMTVVDPGGSAGRNPSLATGPAGEVHIAYHDATGRDLKYAVCRASCTSPAGWSAVIVDAVGDVGREPSLVVDARGRVHVAYYDFGGGALRYATCGGSCDASAAWRLVEVDGDGDVGRSPALAVALDRITIAYEDHTTGNPYPLKVLE